MNQIIDPEKLQIKIKILAKQLSDDHIDDKTPVVAVCILNGGFMFFTDFVKAMPISLECDFMRVKSYVSKRKQGDIQITKDLETPIKGKHVYIIDDIFDTGNTVNAIINYLEKEPVKSITITTLIQRTTSPKSLYHPTNPAISYPVISCFKTDEWLVGYGMDNELGYYRNYKDIFAV